MDLAPLLYILLGGLGSLVMWFVLGPVMTGIGVKRLAKKAAEGDEEALEFFYDLGDVLLRWAAEPRIKTGKKIKIKDDDGEEHSSDEILTPIEMIGRVIGNYVLMKGKAYAGGKKSQMEAQMAEAMAQTGGDVKALIPLAAEAALRGEYGPGIAIMLQMLLNKPKGDTSSGGSMQGW